MRKGQIQNKTAYDQPASWCRCSVRATAIIYNINVDLYMSTLTACMVNCVLSRLKQCII